MTFSPTGYKLLNLAYAYESPLNSSSLFPLKIFNYQLEVGIGCLVFIM
jgi:hypothetical protein